MTMRRLLSFLFLISALGLPGWRLDAQKPVPAQAQIYRWKDAKGRLYITTTPPPPGAKELGLPPEQNTRATEIPKPLVKPGPVQVSEPPNHPLSESQRGFWELLAQNLGDARTKGDRAELEAAADRIFNDSFWGNGLWVLPALPLATLLLLVLLGWVLASRMKGVAKGLVMLFFVILGVGAAQVTLARLVYKAQVQRLTGNLMLLELNLGGGKSLSADHKESLEAHIKDLGDGTRAGSLPWKYILDAAAMKQALRQMVVDP
jgi:membrane-associated protease RseP (regulator of RpoE activity)